MSQTTKLLVILGASLGVIGLIAWLLRRRTNPSTGSSTKACIQVPATYAKWTDKFSGTDWGGYGAAVRALLGEEYSDGDKGPIVAGFFKAIDVEPTSFAVNYFKADLKNWTTTGEALPNWMVEQGAMRCK